VTRPWHRRRSRDADGASDGPTEADGPRETDDISLAGPEHAWWAGRDVERAWAPQPRATRPDPLEVHLGPGWEHDYGFDDLTAPAGGADAADHGDVPPPDVTGGGPYEVLGVEPTASWDEIVASHRAAVRRHHPDRVAGDDHDPGERARAEDSIVRINAAYGELRVRRGR
jgi:hypothetical protein